MAVAAEQRPEPRKTTVAKPVLAARAVAPSVASANAPLTTSARWAPDVDGIDRPALVIWPADDPFVAPRFGARLAEHLHATLLELDGGHWWPLTRAATVAAALETLWARADG